MSNRATKILLIGLLTVGILTFGYYKVDKFLKVDSCLDKGGRWNYETGECETIEPKTESVKLNGYNELANEDSLKQYTISEYNTDLPDVSNIKRPEKSEIVDSKIDTLLLFRIWTLDPNGPHADFHISKKDFYAVDYDGNGSMPYILRKDSLTIFYNDFIQKGRILKVTKDKLTIKWNEANRPTEYVEWRN
jgi:hypothetical protein